MFGWVPGAADSRFPGLAAAAEIPLTLHDAQNHLKSGHGSFTAWEPRMESSHEVTELLADLRDGDESVLDRLTPLVYNELRRIARARLRAEPAGHTLNTTELVHEAYLRLADQTRMEWRDRAHFFAVASRLMRRLLVDFARRRGAEKRGGDLRRVALDDATVSVDDRAATFLALDIAMDRLAEMDERQCRVVECRFFGGMTEEETAEALGVTARTVRRDWVKAKGWLYRELYDDAVD